MKEVIMGNVSTRIYLKRLGKALSKLFIKALVIGGILIGLSYIISMFVAFSYTSVLRFIGFGTMFVGAVSKMAGGELTRDFNYQYSMTAKRVKNRSSYERDTLLSNDSFLITCVLAGSLVFGFSIILDKLI